MNRSAARRLAPSLLSLARAGCPVAATAAGGWPDASCSASGQAFGWVQSAPTASASAAVAAALQWRRHLSTPSAGGSSSGGGKGGGGSGRPRGRRTCALEPQPQLQAWLQRQQGLPAMEADRYARRFALVFGSQQAALGSLPATFAWCHSEKGLTALQTAEVLDLIARQRHDSLVNFASTARLDWQLIDGCISAHSQRLRAAGAKLPKHTSLASVLCSSNDAAHALRTPPGHVAGWLAAVGERLSASEADLGAMLCSHPPVVTGKPATALAAINWAASVLQPADVTALFQAHSRLLKHGDRALQMHQDSLRQACSLTAEQARQLMLKQPLLLTSKPSTVQQSVAWLQQHFPTPEQLFDVVDRAPQLLMATVDRLQGNADYLQRELGWGGGQGQLAAFISKYPQPFATVDLGSPEMQAKLLFLTRVVGAEPATCISIHTSYLARNLGSMAARYMLVQKGAPWLLRNSDGSASLSWIITKRGIIHQCRMGTAEVDAHTRAWPKSPEGQRLLAGLRDGRTEGWPRPGSDRTPADHAQEGQRRQEAAAERKAQKAVSGKAAAAAAKRGRRQTSADGGATAVTASPAVAADQERQHEAQTEAAAEGCGSAAA